MINPTHIDFPSHFLSIFPVTKQNEADKETVVGLGLVLRVMKKMSKAWFIVSLCDCEEVREIWRYPSYACSVFLREWVGMWSGEFLGCTKIWTFGKRTKADTESIVCTSWKVGQLVTRKWRKGRRNQTFWNACVEII